MYRGSSRQRNQKKRERERGGAVLLVSSRAVKTPDHARGVLAISVRIRSGKNKTAARWEIPATVRFFQNPLLAAKHESGFTNDHHGPRPVMSPPHPRTERDDGP
jgi:hypothetical protein